MPSSILGWLLPPPLPPFFSPSKSFIYLYQLEPWLQTNKQTKKSNLNGFQQKREKFSSRNRKLQKHCQLQAWLDQGLNVSLRNLMFSVSRLRGKGFEPKFCSSVSMDKYKYVCLSVDILCGCDCLRVFMRPVSGSCLVFFFF